MATGYSSIPSSTALPFQRFEHYGKPGIIGKIEKIGLKIGLEPDSHLPYIFHLWALTELAKKSYLELTPKLRAWWSSVDHPKRLAVYAEAICKDEGIGYTEPLNNQGPWNNPLAIQDAHTGPVSPPTANTSQNPDEPHHASGTADSTSDISRNNPQFELASEASLNDLNFPPAPEQRVFENASLQGVAEVFNQDMSSAIRRLTVQDESKAAVTTVFPIWAGTIDCLMSLEVNEWSVEWLVMALFNAKLKWVNQARHVVFNEGVTLIIPNSEATLKGVLNEAILNVFGPEIHEAVTESPMRRKELAEGMRVTECVSMILTRDGAIINLALGLDGGVKIQNKLYT
ncbi:uncharacterized protein GIQ15_04301 [Arthroderma uncinatum]|uniref:uncharacterized protein n=1 Tax=Arthroderma uncinatum TaxID=74035 RepID=UPI00144A5611|nr:uncharacterized protein GIQ15_04301 [Arthroderma uncinatum]KAF3481542.1 hypothetical protein GIQ15_04301 [Arthroderma uncinatum]